MSGLRFSALNARLEAGGPYAKATFAGGVFFAVFFILYFLTSHPPHDAYGYIWGRDFSIFWLVGHEVAQGQTDVLYHFLPMMRQLFRFFGSIPSINWGYPPYAVWGLIPFGALPYFPALILWSGLGLGLYLFLGIHHDGRGQLWFLLASPAVAVCLYLGQNGFYTAVLLIGTLYFLDRKPVLAGILLGLLCFKPHLGFLFPVALACSRRWKCFAAAAVCFVVQVAASWVAFGPALWQAYLGPGLAYQTHLVATGVKMLLYMGPTAFFNARLMGASPHLALLVQIPFLCFALLAVGWTYLRCRDRRLSQAVLVTALFVGSPYMQAYDLVVMGWVVASVKDRLTGPWDTRLLFAVWWLPVACILFGLLHLPLAAPLMAAFLFRLVWHLGKLPSQSWRRAARNA